MKKFIFFISMMAVGGSIGAYSLLACGTFANMQTGNLIKLFIVLGSGFSWQVWVQCLLPILGFLIGVLYIKIFENNKFMPKIAIITECVLVALTAVCFGEFWLNVVASVLLSMCAGIELQAFHTFEDKFFATTMCTNNMRNIVDFLYEGITKKDKLKLKTSGKISVFVLVFAISALISAVLYTVISRFAVLINLLYLAVAFVCLEKNETQK